MNMYIYIYIHIWGIYNIYIYIYIYIYGIILSAVLHSLPDPGALNSCMHISPNTPNLPTNIVPTNIARLKLSGKLPRGLEIPPLRIKIVLESNPLKSTMLVARLAVPTFDIMLDYVQDCLHSRHTATRCRALQCAARRLGVSGRGPTTTGVSDYKLKQVHTWTIINHITTLRHT